MWLFELLGLVLVVGTVSGLVWRFAEDWMEKRSIRQQAEALYGVTEDEDVSVPVPATVSVPATNSANKPN